MAPDRHPTPGASSTSWKRRVFSRRSDDGGTHHNLFRIRRSVRDESSAKGKGSQRFVRFNESQLSTGATPGSSQWIVQLILAALDSNAELFIIQRAMQTLGALDIGSSKWREVNQLLANRTPNSVAAAATALAEREEQAQKLYEETRANLIYRSSDFEVVGRNFSHEDMSGNVYCGSTYFVKPPLDWVPPDPNGMPPTIDRAPKFCLFLMPKRPYNPVDPYRIWLLDADRRWVVVEQYATHPDPKYFPRVLRLQPNDKTPNWVLPDTVRRKPVRKPPLGPSAISEASSIPTPQVFARNTDTAGPSTRSRSRAAASPNAEAGPSRATPSWSRARQSPVGVS